MPCNSDYMNASNLEVELSRVSMLIEEVKTGVPVNTKSPDWSGYKSGIYRTVDLKKRLDTATAYLCSLLQKADASKYSLEMQIWWRDHQAADRAREAREKEEAHRKVLRESALSKLTDEERDALGLN